LLTTPLLQVQQGKLTPKGPVAWLAFKTDSSDMRTCGVNVQPSSRSAVVTAWTAGPIGRFALNSVILTCSASAALTTIATAGFTAALPAVQSLGYGLPAACTPVLTKPSADPADNLVCKGWLATNPAKLKPSPNQCPCE
jgi:hypothetical protein